MIYPKKNEPLSPELFKNPTSEYRGAPFWALNCKLDKQTLSEQIGYLKEMGFGGFHMHVRTGMATPYLSDEYMGYIRHCVEKAKSEQMRAYLYDEDRWPSGAAGGIVTKNPEYRQKYLRITAKPYEKREKNDGSEPRGRLVACFDVELDDGGYLKSYRQIGAEEDAKRGKWYAYLETPKPDPWYNNQTYVDTLSKKAIDEFIKVTYGSYDRTVKDDFGNTIPSIFTDEPQYSIMMNLGFAKEKSDLILPWTTDFPETYRKAYGGDIVAHLPELLWELPDGKISVERYHYHDHVTERFAEAFADNCGGWCKEHGILLTGHVLLEESLESQTKAVGEAMRMYRSFGLPGIDMLCNNYEYTTAKQAQSVSHQDGRPGMLSELYGVTGWHFDFRGHKLQGDWQAALGVTLRVPHLSWVSMAGEAKRDYPASINYQSPWFREYPIVENHFARVNTALTRGEPVAKVGVIHPIESYWLHWGPDEQTALLRNQMDTNFHHVAEWLLFGLVDFDFISESLLPRQCEKGGSPLAVGKMKYDTVIVPGCETLRSTTVERLAQFKAAGGKLIFMGSAPKYVDAVPDEKAKALYHSATVIPFEEYALLEELEPDRLVDIRMSSGARTGDLIYNMRNDSGCLWLFIAKGKPQPDADYEGGTDCRIFIKGTFRPELYDTMTGEIRELHAEYQNGKTVIGYTFYPHDSLLLKLTGGKSTAPECPRRITEKQGLSVMNRVSVTLSEPNVLLLDMAEYALDGEEYHPMEEILRADNICREKLHIPSRRNAVAQPWTIRMEEPKHTVHLRYKIASEIDVVSPLLALEDAEKVAVEFNGKKVPSAVTGYYVDKSIQTIRLPDLPKGENTLVLHIPFGERTNVESCYLLGDFGVKVEGTEKTVTLPARRLGFGDITPQGLPFYGGNVTYHVPFESAGGDTVVRATLYRGALIAVSLDGKRVGEIVYSPYELLLKNVPKGSHRLDLTLFGNRANTFGCVHVTDPNYRWLGPDCWRTTGSLWCYEYVLKRTGILKSPEIIGIG